MPKLTAARTAAQRQRVLDAALDCFAADGFHRTTMQDIIERSGLSAGAIYGYFSSKEEVVETIAAERHAHEQTLIAEALRNAEPATVLRSFVERYFTWLEDPAEQLRRRVTVQVWAEALRDDRMLDLVMSGVGQTVLAVPAIAEAQRSGAIRDDVSAEALARTVLALILGFVLQQTWEPDLDLALYREAAVALVVSGFGAREH